MATKTLEKPKNKPKAIDAPEPPKATDEPDYIPRVAHPATFMSDHFKSRFEGVYQLDDTHFLVIRKRDNGKTAGALIIEVNEGDMVPEVIAHLEGAPSLPVLA